MLEHKNGNIYETRKDKETLLWIGGTIGTRQCSFERYHPRSPYARLFPNIGFRNSHPKLQSLSHERVKLRTCTRIHGTKSPLKISGKVAVCVVRDPRKFS